MSKKVDTNVKDLRQDCIDKLCWELEQLPDNRYTFKKKDCKIDVERTKYSAKDVVVCSIFTDNDGWLRVNGVTKEYVFAEITVFSDAVKTEDLKTIYENFKQELREKS